MARSRRDRACLHQTLHLEATEHGVGAGRLALRCIAEDRGVSVQQVILAWELALASVIPISGASRAASIQDSARAADLELTADEISKLSDAE
jgi:aryl-alcohol dehydrogenase-like predicted oxidoreductase